MIYVDTSVILAELFSEDFSPGVDFWQQQLISSRLSQYETWVNVNQKGDAVHKSAAQQILMRIQFLELSPQILLRALEPFSQPIRTLDALHVASLDFLIKQNIPIRLASYDNRLSKAAGALGVELFSLL